jgi:hypothetical protein
MFFRSRAVVLRRLRGYPFAARSQALLNMSKSVIGRVASARICGAEGIKMADITIVFWRDIPAQVIAGKGRRGVKKPLPERFEQAIDRCAMKIGARDSDAYLAEWRKGAMGERPGDDATAAEAEVARILSDYDAARIAALIANDGWEPPTPA